MVSSLGQPRVAYTPRPIIAARETGAGLWVWHPQRMAPETMRLDAFLARVAATASFNPRPLILFSFAQHNDGPERSRLRFRIAIAAKCTRVEPCVEGTVAQLR